MVADDIIDRDANGKGDSAIDDLPVDLFGKELGRLGGHDSLSKLADIQDFGPGQALRDDSLQGEIDNFGSLLVLGANIATRQTKKKGKSE